MRLLTKVSLVLLLPLAAICAGLVGYLYSAQTRELEQHEAADHEAMNHRIAGVLALLMSAAEHSAAQVPARVEALFASEGAGGKVLDLRLFPTETLGRERAAKDERRAPADGGIWTAGEIARVLGGETIERELEADGGEGPVPAKAFLAPVRADARCIACHDVGAGQPLLALSTVFSRERTYREGARQMRELLLFTVGGFALVWLFLLWALGRMVVSPLTEVSAAARRIAKDPGHDDRVTVRAGGEVGDLSASFNRMVDRLRESSVSREYFESLLGSMAEGVVVTDAKGRILWANRAARRLMGLGDALPDLPVGVLFHDLGVPDGWRRELADRGRLLNVEATLNPPGGRPAAVLLSGTVVRQRHGDPEEHVLILTDVSELERTRETLRRTEERLRETEERSRRQGDPENALLAALSSVRDKVAGVASSLGRSGTQLREDLDEIRVTRRRRVETGPIAPPGPRAITGKGPGNGEDGL